MAMMVNDHITNNKKVQLIIANSCETDFECGQEVLTHNYHLYIYIVHYVYFPSLFPSQ